MLTLLLNVLAWKRCLLFFFQGKSREIPIFKKIWMGSFTTCYSCWYNLERQLDLNMLPTASLLVTYPRRIAHSIELTPPGFGKGVYMCCGSSCLLDKGTWLLLWIHVDRQIWRESLNWGNSKGSLCSTDWAWKGVYMCWQSLWFLRQRHLASNLESGSLARQLWWESLNWGNCEESPCSTNQTCNAI